MRRTPRPVFHAAINRQSSSFAARATAHPPQYYRKLSPPVIMRDEPNDSNRSLNGEGPQLSEPIESLLSKVSKKELTPSASSSTRLLLDRRTLQIKQQWPLSFFEVELSTEQNYCTDDEEFYGEFVDIRQSLDYNFHSNYIRERQLFQDKIIIDKFEDPVITDLHGNTCARPENPWIVFTAGARGRFFYYAFHKLTFKLVVFL